MKSFIFFILGAAVGTVGGVFATKFIMQAKAEQKIAEATVEARDYYKEKYEKDVEKKSDEVAHQKIASVYQSHQNEDRIFGNAFAISQATPIRDTMVNYRENPVDENGNKNYIYMIDADEAGLDDYTQYALDYYQDGSLVDEDGNLVDEPFNIAGNYLDELSLENPEIYVRNDVTKTEYDICYIAASYEQPGGVYD